MNILIYNWKDIKNPLVGGAEIIIFEYARRLAAQGHYVTWFCRSFAGADTEETINSVHIVRKGNACTTYWKGFEYYRSLPKKPDIVIDMLNTIAWQTPLYAHKKSKIVQFVNQLAKEVWNYELPPPFSWAGRFLEPLQLIPYHHQRVITYANSTAKELIDWGYDRNNIHQFQLGLDHERYVPGNKATYPLFLQVCRMVKMKRPDLTVRAFAEVLKEFPEARLALIGTGPNKAHIDRLIAKLHIDKQIMRPEKDSSFFTKTNDEQKIRLMQEAWCFVHPSVKEGWGMVITEAAACGTPSIVTEVTGQIDSVKKDETGLIISANPTVKELANAMKKIITDTALRARMSNDCISWAANFDWDKSYNQFTLALEQASGLSLTYE